MSKHLLTRYDETGAALIAKLQQSPANIVLDLGCEYNIYKPYIPNIIGVDISNPSADVLADISVLPFSDNYADTILLLGILYCTELELIAPGVYSDNPTIILDKQISEVFRVAKAGAKIYCRTIECSILNKHTIDYYTKKYNLKYRVEPKYILNKHIHKYRLYWVWEVTK